MLPILALSGQHVWSLVAILGLALFPPMLLACRFRAHRLLRFYPAARAVLPLAASSLLWLTSGGAPSMLRTTGMALAVFLLRWRKLDCSPLQVTASSVAILFLLEPSLITSTGFMMSAGATALNLRAMGERGGRRWFALLYTTAGMPLLLTPISIFYFAKFSPQASLCTVLLGWFWEGLVIPFAFFLPALVGGLSETIAHPLIRFLERNWERALLGHSALYHWIEPGQRIAPRPSLGELFWLECALAILFVGVGQWLFCDRDSASEESARKRLHFIRKGFPINGEENGKIG